MSLCASIDRKSHCRPSPLLPAILVYAGLLHLASGREVKEKSPTPCKKEYNKAFIKEMAEAYIKQVPAVKAHGRMLLLLGGSGAGKGTFLKRVANHGFALEEYIMHGIDDYLEMLPEWKETAADKANVYMDAADGCYGGAIPMAKTAQAIIIERKLNVIYEETGKNLDRILKRVLPPFKDAGYQISIALVDSTPELAVKRAEGRFQTEGRYSSPEYVASTFNNVHSSYSALRAMADIVEAVYCDNTCTAPDFDCMKCWADSSTGIAAWDDKLIPQKALEAGPAKYYHQGANLQEL
eukprot:CAMPEP_0172675228 /NCGR_PEP_ID=MMETSP1074-20121228/13154_1 /TAXON_ID=2916 /ORGANISM="Ceratium fusus, Strain PA161109" /LENGTH=294 /DNA_ID=CAMNT_0013492677 /DNA_START=68 /DNA_END=952 /DNA_ORIENTATION=+